MANPEQMRAEMRANAQIQIEEQEEQNFERFCSFVDGFEKYDSAKAFEGLAEIQRADNMAKMIQFSLQHMVNSGEIKTKG